METFIGVSKFVRDFLVHTTILSKLSNKRQDNFKIPQ